MVEISLALKSNIFLYKSTEVIAIAQKYRVFSMNTSNDKAGYIDNLVWFDSINVHCSQKEKEKQTVNQNTDIGCISNPIISLQCEEAPPQHPASTRLHHPN